jgi:hypothetical protein
MAKRFCLALLIALWPVAVSAQAMTINAAGSYTVPSDLSDPSTVVQINASNVTLFLNGHTLTCTPTSGQTATTYGIAAANLHHVRIQGPGNIRNCWMGVQLGYGSEHIVEGVDVSQNRYIGINAGFGYGNLFRDLDCDAIGGFYTEAYAICLNGVGVNSRVESVRIHEIYKQAISPAVGEGIGILVEWGATGVVLDDVQMVNQTVATHTIGVWVTDHHRGEGTYTENSAPPPPPPPPPPPTQGGETIPWHVCFGTPQVCYSGTLTRVTP